MFSKTKSAFIKILVLIICVAFILDANRHTYNKSALAEKTTSYPLPQTPVSNPYNKQSSQSNRVYLPIIRHNTFPFTRSFYIWSTDYASNMFQLGNEYITSYPHGGIVIFSFGQPAIVQNNGTIYGTRLVGSTNFTPISTIENAIKNFILGYTSSPEYRTDGPKLAVAIGLNNFDDGQSSLSNTHGAEWAKLVSRVHDWVQANSMIRSVVSVYGAIDIEMTFSSPTKAIDWVGGYNSAATRDIFNFGSCDGCPYLTANENALGSVPLNGWTIRDVWTTAWRFSYMYPLPQIYRNDGAMADQWYRMSLWGVQNRPEGNGLPMIFRGVMTQVDACITNPGPECNNTTLEPSIAFLQLRDKIFGDSRTIPARDMTWATDISWRIVAK